jgi:phage-related protein
VGSSRRDFAELPDEVQAHTGYALHLAQVGDKHDDAKPLSGFGGAGVMEIVSDHQGNAFRTARRGGLCAPRVSEEIEAWRQDPEIRD